MSTEYIKTQNNRKRMLIDRKFKSRHKILQTLRAQAIPYDHLENFNLYDMQLSINELSRLAKLSKARILEQIDYLNSVREIDIQWIDNEAYYHITPSGTIALYDDKYIEMGKNKRFSKFKETITLVSAIIVTSIALFTFIDNYLSTKKNNKAIEDIQRQVQDLSRKTVQKQKESLKLKWKQ
ncbi:hypothetical protein [Pedobacter aquatilis]|uniref:hypothetical protein n=1 Tax=Pedobacter aquatilis TaxID=351343 RepID=UPI002930783E|nr:hypothetical protein [Pedobacter aquatilis]